MGHHASTRSTAARRGPGRAATGMPRTKTLGVPATPARDRALGDERRPGQVGALADRLRELLVGDADLLAELDKLAVGQAGSTLGGLVLEQRPGVLVEHAGIRGRRRGRPGRVPSGRHRVEEVHRMVNEADDPLLHQLVHQSAQPSARTACKTDTESRCRPPRPPARCPPRCRPRRKWHRAGREPVGRQLDSRSCRRSSPPGTSRASVRQRELRRAYSSSQVGPTSTQEPDPATTGELSDP
jgi:hypothetical protein